MDTIKLLIPAKENFASTVRLTTASILNQMNFDFEVVEDIKVAISEAFNMLICADEILIEYRLKEEGLEIFVSIPESSIVYKTDIGSNLGRQILSSLADEVEYKESYIRIYKGKE